jgi:predicted Zn-dependent peptidase
MINISKLKNGITIIGEENLALHSVGITILLPIGSSYEEKGNSGIFSMIQDYLFKGTQKYDAKELANEIDKYGVKYSYHTGKEFSVFSFSLEKNYIKEALAIFKEIISNPKFPEQELNSIREVSLSELISLEDKPMSKMLYEIMQKFFPYPLSNPSQGKIEDINSITFSQIVSTYKNFYFPEGMIISISGNFIWNEILKYVEELFSDVKLKKLEKITPVYQNKDTYHIEKNTEQTHIGIAFDFVSYSNDEYLKAQLAVNSIFGGMSNRLFTEVREKRGLAYSVGGRYFSTKEFGGILCYAGTTHEKAKECIKIILDEVNNMRNGITQKEFEKGNARVRMELVTKLENSLERASDLATEFFYRNSVKSVEDTLSEVSKITIDEINAFFKKYAPNEFLILTVGKK